MRYSLTQAGLNFLEEAKTPKRHGIGVEDRIFFKGEREAEEFEKSGGPKDKLSGDSPEFAGDEMEGTTPSQLAGHKARYMRKKRLTTQLKLKDKLRRASAEMDPTTGETRSQSPASKKLQRKAVKRIARMHRTQDVRGGKTWRGRDETDFSQEHGRAYPGAKDLGSVKKMTIVAAPPNYNRYKRK